MSGSRIEKDSFGPIEVPADRLWGAQTERSRRFFRISSERMPLAVVYALTLVKQAAAAVNVNLGQSSNDVFPTAMHIAAARALLDDVLPAVQRLAATLAAKQAAFDRIVKIGRTHLQDATPLTLGQEFSGYVAQLELASQAIRDALPRLYQLAIGGTAVGTGLNTHPQFADRVCERISRETGVRFVSAPNKFAALAGHEPLVSAHGALQTLAAALNKLANDVRL